MNPTQAAWVRAHAWTAPIRRDARRSHPNVGVGPCLCQRPFTAAICHGSTGTHECTAPYIYTVEAVLLSSAGARVYDSAPRSNARGTAAMWVWLVDRMCRHRCGCACHPGQTQMRHPATDQAPQQFDLFAGAT